MTRGHDFPGQWSSNSDTPDGAERTDDGRAFSARAAVTLIYRCHIASYHTVCVCRVGRRWTIG